MLEVLSHRAKFGGAQISPAAGEAKNVDFFTGSIARSASLPIFNLLKGRFCGFSPRTGDTLHRWG